MECQLNQNVSVLATCDEIFEWSPWANKMFYFNAGVFIFKNCCSRKGVTKVTKLHAHCWAACTTLLFPWGDNVPLCPPKCHGPKNRNRSFKPQKVNSWVTITKNNHQLAKCKQSVFPPVVSNICYLPISRGLKLVKRYQVQEQTTKKKTVFKKISK